MCGKCLQCLGHTGFAPAHGVCAFPVYSAQAGGCSAGELSKAGPGLHALLRSKILAFRYCSDSQVLHKGTDSGHVFCALPGLSSLGSQVFGECSVFQVGGAS